MSMPIQSDNKLQVFKLGIYSATIAIVLVAAGCGKSPDDHDKVPFEQSPQGQADAKQVAQDKSDYAYAQRAEYVKDMKAKIAALSLEADNLSATVEKGSDAVKAEAKPKLQALRDQITKLNAELDAVPSATESTWDAVKSGFGKGYDSLKDGIASARQWVSDKIKP
jgi:cytochrome c556